MTYWIIDRTLPGVIASLAVTVPVWVSHVLLKRHMSRITDRQNEHLDRLTADQTAALAGRNTGGAS